VTEEKDEFSIKDVFYECINQINPRINRTRVMLLVFEVMGYYNEYHRKYHTIEHIKHGLNLLRDVEDLCRNYYLVQFAWFYHDLIYIPTYNYNESASAHRAFFDAWQFDFSEEERKEIFSLVMATDHYHESVTEKDEEIIHDVDLAVLGSEPEKYKEYSGQIKLEYMIYKKNFKKERIKILQDFLDSEFIYYTEYFRDRFGEQALTNISDELENLIGT
jgi:predicted metal-dependent HD superfamily phosphohydrolase